MGVSPDCKNVIVSETLTNDSSLTLGIYSYLDKTKRLFKIATSAAGNHFKLFDFAASAPHLVLLLSESNEVYMADMNKLRHIAYLNMEKQSVNCIRVCADDPYMVSIGCRDSIRIYRLQ